MCFADVVAGNSSGISETDMLITFVLVQAEQL